MKRASQPPRSPPTAGKGNFLRRAVRAPALVLALAAHLALSGVARARVDVYMGFMDEEVNDQVAQLIRSNPNRRVIVVERGSTAGTDGRLFERPLASYPGGKPTITTTSGLGSSAVSEGDSLETVIAKGIKARVETDSFRARIANNVMPEGATPKTVPKGGVPDTSMTVIGYNGSAPPENPIVLIRSPEMGLQPELVAPYFEPALDTIGTLPQATKAQGGVQASMFGTGGAVSEHLPPIPGQPRALAVPGTRSSVKGTVYVGVELVPGSKPPRYQAVVAVNDGKNAPTYFFKSEYPTREAATEAAKLQFKSKHMGEEIAKEGPFKGKSLNATLDSIDPNKEKQISVTVSFFAGEDVKKAGAHFGLSNVNMEDYHVFNATRGRVDSIGVTRLNCDPHEITPDMVKQVTGWARETKYSAGSYADAVLWGLRGSKKEDLLKACANGKACSGNWAAGEKSPFKGMSYEKMSEMALTMKAPGGVPVVLDPFYAEIAADFIKDAAKGEIFTNRFKDPSGVVKTTYTRMISEKITSNLTPGARLELDQMMEGKSKKIQWMAEDILDHFKKGPPAGMDPAKWEEGMRAQIIDMMGEAADLSVIPARSPTLAAEMDILTGPPIKGNPKAGLLGGSKAEFYGKEKKIRLLGAENTSGSGEGRAMEIWVREGKWPDNSTRTLDHMLAEPVLKDLDKRGVGTTHETLAEAFEHGKLDSVAVDRALFKATITPGTQIYGPLHVDGEDPVLALRSRETRADYIVGALTEGGAEASAAKRVGIRLKGLCGGAGGAL